MKSEADLVSLVIKPKIEGWSIEMDVVTEAMSSRTDYYNNIDNNTRQETKGRIKLK